MLDSISLLDLRGYASLDATFGPGPHLVWGPNAAGKSCLKTINSPPEAHLTIAP